MAVTAANPRTGRSADEQDFVELGLHRLQPGAVLQSPIFDARPGRRQFLLAAGQELTSTQLESLKNRGVAQVMVSRADLKALGIADVAELRPAPVEREPVEAVPTGWKRTPESFFHELKPVSGVPDRETVTRFQEAFHDSLNITDQIFDRMLKDSTVRSQDVLRISVDSLHRLIEDIDLYVAQGIQPVDDHYPTRQSVQTAMLASAMGTVMGLSQKELLDLSFGCLLHDAGLLLLPKSITHPRADMTSADRLDYMKHPLVVEQMLSSQPSISPVARLVAAQMHERLDGSGFPKQQRGPQIHPLSRIAGVADSYLAMVSPGPVDPGVSPHRAIEQILQDTRRGLYDPASSRALLHAVSLFPLGSTVRLQDGRVGRVIRSNRENYSRPVIQVVNRTEHGQQVEVIDLSQQPEIEIASAGPSLKTM